jgi:FkbM family methyltransferase
MFKKIRIFNNPREFLFALYNRFFTLKMYGIEIPKRNAKLVIAHLRLNKFKSYFTIEKNEIHIKMGKYNLTSSLFDESILMSFEEHILKDEYQLGSIDMRNKTIIDIGANIGDTALNFVNRGVKRVYSLEPIPQTFSYLIRNISNNSLENVIIPLNYGIGNKNEKMVIPIRENASGGNSVTFHKRNLGNKSYKKNVEVSLITLKDLWDMIKTNADIIKIDCEGCEYSIIQNNDLIDLFNPEYIIIEYHSGWQKIKNWLKLNEYEIVNALPKSKDVGIIIARKKQL